jgi:hypothetical protein
MNTIRWLRAKQRERPYNFAATAKCKVVKPMEADAFGPNRSVVLDEGVRTFFFETEQARDGFCQKFRAASVPIPDVALSR